MTPDRGGRMAVLLALLSVCLIVVDVRGGTHSPVSSLRSAVGTVVGPVETVAGNAARPFRQLSQAFQTNQTLRRHVATLQAQNSDLRGRLATSGVDRNRLAEYDGLQRTARNTGYTLVPAQVVAMGPAQSFSRTVTIDAGSEDGLRPDLTVLNNDGLVGRVVAVTPSTATVQLIVDTASTVGARLASSMKIGFVRGQGVLGTAGRLALTLVDSGVVPARGDDVVSWGSADGGPFVAGIPIGTVTAVYSTPRELTRQAVVRPFADFTALDVVGVVVPASTKSARVIRPGGGR